ncbi:Hexuronate transporter [Methylobacterium tardum]|uniref:Hexuronate transporter n=1 Tax=Methylobacterium tardum TaxID=374432 RepID=A0AA37TIY0_9HYPH|nr:MFS transporter [Methylobacterium tardum]URD34567.1 MFS transporter [Methylobacterium tardum]GJE48402.1 Hexuronate transporter [Methylobacterium tardum]GLS73012.1 hexuronate transporter [Methylobacterium tardum]
MNQTEKQTKFRFVIFSSIVVIAMINYIDRGAISYAAADITAEYNLDRAAWGAVLGYFGYGYMFGALIGGALGDRFGAKLVWLIAGIAWSVFEIATAYAGDFGMAALGGSALAGFAVVRVLFGFSEGPAYSIINKTVGNWATPRERGFAVSIGLLSTPLGALLTAPMSVGLLLLTGSWRAMFWILGITGLVALLAFMRIFTNRPEDNPRVNAAELAEIRSGTSVSDAPSTSIGRQDADVPWWMFFTSRTMVFNTIGYFAFIYVNFMLLTWTPKYLQDQFHFNLASLWYLGMIPWTGPCLTVLLGGRFSDWLLKRTGNLRIARSWFAALTLLLTTLVFLGVSQATSPAAVIALMTLGNSLNALVNTVYWTVVIDTAPREHLGAWSGFMHFFANIGSVLAPTLAGILASTYGYQAMFIATAVATGIGMAAMLLVSPGVLPVRRGAVPR